MENIRQTIERAWDDRSMLSDGGVQAAVREVIDLLDKGSLRVAEPCPDGSWKVNEWVKKAVVMYFPIQPMETLQAGPLQWYDKIPLKQDYLQSGVRMRACGRSALRSIHIQRCHTDAVLCQYRRLCR